MLTGIRLSILSHKIHRVRTTAYRSVGDPSRDLAVVWTLLSEHRRELRRDRLQIDEATWALGDTGVMKSQVAREEHSVTIAAGLGILLGVLAAGALVLAIVGVFSDMSETFDAGFTWVIALSLLCCGVYLVRHRK